MIAVGWVLVTPWEDSSKADDVATVGLAVLLVELRACPSADAVLLLEAGILFCACSEYKVYIHSLHLFLVLDYVIK